MIKINNKRTLMLAMGVLVLLGFGISQMYYNYQNKGVDPRTIEAREMYSRYDSYAESNNFKAVFSLLDSIENIYSSIPHYKNSYEVGVLYNNKAAAYLSIALYFESNSVSINGTTTLSKDTLLYLSKVAVKTSIEMYNNWLAKYTDLTLGELEFSLQNSFLTGLNNYNEALQQRFIKTRVKEIQEAKYETPRRLSVAYTNLGIIERHTENYEAAINNYKKAIEFWDKNLAAQNNLNTLLGLPHKKQNIIEKILPPSKKKQLTTIKYNKQYSFKNQ